jgi:hypothetical protein
VPIVLKGAELPMPPELEVRDVSTQEMYAVVGSLFFLCAVVERELEKSIAALLGDTPLVTVRGLGQNMAFWVKLQQGVAADRQQHKAILDEVCTCLGALKDIRNRFAHGLIGWQAGRGQEAVKASLTTTLNGEELVLTYGEIQDRLRLFDRMINVIRRLTAAAKESDLGKAEGRYVRYEPISCQR